LWVVAGELLPGAFPKELAFVKVGYGQINGAVYRPANWLREVTIVPLITPGLSP
jgi:hypothetical protein